MKKILFIILIVFSVSLYAQEFNELPVADQIEEDDLFVIEQDDSTRSVTIDVMRGAIDTLFMKDTTYIEGHKDSMIFYINGEERLSYRDGGTIGNGRMYLFMDVAEWSSGNNDADVSLANNFHYYETGLARVEFESDNKMQFYIEGGTGFDAWYGLQEGSTHHWSIGQRASDGGAIYFNPAFDLDASPIMKLSKTGGLFINETVNSKQNVGLTISQGLSSVDHVISFKQASVDHGMTTQAETDTYGFIFPNSPSGGGMNITGINDNYSGALLFRGAQVTGGPAWPVIKFIAYKKSGTTFGSLADTDMAITFRNNSTDLMNLYGDGDIHITGAIKHTMLTGSLTDGAPTDAEIDAIVGLSAASSVSGWSIPILDSDGTGLIYKIISDGSSWQFITYSKAL